MTWTVLSGNSAEAAAVQVPTRADVTGTWVAGINYRVRPRVGDVSAYLKLANTTTNPWVIERCTAGIIRTGKQRVR